VNKLFYTLYPTATRGHSIGLRSDALPTESDPIFFLYLRFTSSLVRSFTCLLELRSSAFGCRASPSPPHQPSCDQSSSSWAIARLRILLPAGICASVCAILLLLCVGILPLSAPIACDRNISWHLVCSREAGVLISCAHSVVASSRIAPARWLTRPRICSAQI
jgi:hypothetical protein